MSGVNFGGPSATMSLNGKDSLHGNFTLAKTQRIAGYNVICEILSSAEASQWEKSLNSDTGLYLLKNVDEQHKQEHFILYGSSRAIANHMEFAVEHELAGVLAFAIDMDDYKGKCKLDEDIFDDFEGATLPKRDGNAFPLLKTMNEALDIAVQKRAQSDSCQNTTSRTANGIADNRARNPYYGFLIE